MCCYSLVVGKNQSGALQILHNISHCKGFSRPRYALQCHVFFFSQKTMQNTRYGYIAAAQLDSGAAREREAMKISPMQKATLHVLRGGDAP